MTTTAQDPISAQMKETTNMARQFDIDTIYQMVQKWRDGGITPSKCVEKAMDAAEHYVRENYAGISQWKTDVLSTHIWEEAIKRAGVHAAQRREAKDK